MCEFADTCEFADGINFCDDCLEYAKCTIRGHYCKAGHEIECNNGFEDKNIYCFDESEDEEY